MRSLILLANKISRELRKSSCRPAGAPESSPRSSTARARRRRRATPHGRIRMGRCSPGERPTSPTPASARPPTRAHPDPEPHRTMRWRLMYAVRPVSVPDNARRYGPAVRFRERYSGNGGASGRSTTDYRGVHGSLRSPFTFRGLAARFTPRSRLRGLASLDLAMRSRLATLAVHVIEALTSVRASLCADRDSREHCEREVGRQTTVGSAFTARSAHRSRCRGLALLGLAMRRPGFEPDAGRSLPPVALRPPWFKSLRSAFPRSGGERHAGRSLAVQRSKNAPTGI